MQAELGPDAALGYPTPVVGDALDDQQTPLVVTELCGGIGGRIEHASIYHFKAQAVGTEIKPDFDGVSGGIAGVLDAIGHEFRGDYTGVVEDRAGDIVSQGVNEPPGLGGGLRPGRDVSLKLHWRLLVGLHNLYPGYPGGNRHVK
jgi:hypothetical protein